ncbi:MAG TPA: hypothetical protein VF995_01260 [Actinomycetota bacterium]
MAHEEPLRISCDGCPDGCKDCLVGFFFAERDAEVLRLGAVGADATPALPATVGPGTLPPDLARVLGALSAAGLEPQVLDLRRRRRRAS